MATVNIVFAKVGGRSKFGAWPVYAAENLQSENITSSGTSTASTNSAVEDQIARITVTGGNVYIAAAASPTATTSSVLVLAETTFDLAVSKVDKIAVIDA